MHTQNVAPQSSMLQTIIIYAASFAEKFIIFQTETNHFPLFESHLALKPLHVLLQR